MKIKLIKKSELSHVGHKIKKIMGKTYLVRKSGESYEVIEFICRHQFASLESGKLEGKIITCARHGWKYNIITGECVFGDGSPLKFCKFEEDEDWLYLILDLE